MIQQKNKSQRTKSEKHINPQKNDEKVIKNKKKIINLKKCVIKLDICTIRVNKIFFFIKKMLCAILV